MVINSNPCRPYEKGENMYRHTFYLHDGTQLVSYSKSEHIGHISFGREVALIGYDEDNYLKYTIPFTSVGYIETEELDDEE